MVLVRVMSATDMIMSRRCNWQRLSGIMRELCGEESRHGGEIVIAAYGMRRWIACPQCIIKLKVPWFVTGARLSMSITIMNLTMRQEITMGSGVQSII